MKTYDNAGTCIKCGYGGIEDEHFEGFNPDEQLIKIKTQRIHERIERTCKNCGYSWDEKPLDDEAECSFNMYVEAFVQQISKATGETREEILKKFESGTPIFPDGVEGKGELKHDWSYESKGIVDDMKSLVGSFPVDPGGIKTTCDGAKPGKPMTEEEIQARMKEFAKKLDSPLFEVGDETQSACGNKGECKVIGLSGEGMYSLQSIDSPWCSCCNNDPGEMPDMSSLILVRKGWSHFPFEPDGSTEDILRRIRKQYPRKDDQPDTPASEADHDFYYSPDGKLMLAIRKKDVITYKLSEPRDPATATYDGVFKKW